MRARLFIITAILFIGLNAPAVILLRTGDPAANTTEPSGTLAGSGWQYEGFYSVFLGTVIAPHFFITAQHFGTPSNTFSFQGATYNIVQSFDDPYSDLRVFEVAETFPVAAPLYYKNDEIGQHLVVFGRGTQRGSEVFADGILRGWNWGAADTVLRWGENDVADVVRFVSIGDMLYASFDGNGRVEEAHLSGGDSGGAVFLSDNGIWKLAAINYAVDGPFHAAPGDGGFNAALFDIRGSYDDNGNLISGSAPLPSGFYASRISSKIDWIQSVIGPALANISARALIGSGDNVCIAGFIIHGDGAKKKRILVRGIGPSLETNGDPLPGRLADPALELHDPSGALIQANNDWRASQENEIRESGLAPDDDKEAALIAELSPGNYTAILHSADANGGIGLLELYDLDRGIDPQMENLSARADVENGDSVLIGGLIVRSTRPLLLRALGPDLASRGVSGVLNDPVLELHDANGDLIIGNDDWRDAPDPDAIEATGLAPAYDRESAILTTPAPGNYTAVVSGKNSTGIGLIEAYLLER